MMATTVAKQTLIDGERNLIVKIDFVGDADADATDQNLIDVSAYNGHGVNWNTVRIDRMKGHLRGFGLDLEWDATTNVNAWHLPADEDFDFTFKTHGGLVNNAGTGVTGDILYDEVGMGAGDEGSVVVEMVKKS